MLHRTPLNERALDLNYRFDGAKAEAVMMYALDAGAIGDVALVSSFGAESVVLLHMLAQTAPEAPVIFVDTEMLFPETTAYQVKLTETLGLTDVRVTKPAREQLIVEDNENLLHLYDTTACCALRKARPLEAALGGFDGWITGRKRYQGAVRQGLAFFEAESEARLKINPLAYWTRENIAAYISEHALPRHPLVSKGFPSLGCVPCTSKVTDGEDVRAGRWRGQDKTECGIHFVGGQTARN
jgi:phosphoadenosine phosphosulfate reductase